MRLSRRWGLLLCTAAVCLLVGGLVGQALGNVSSPNQTAIGGIWQEEKPCSFYIFTDGSYYYSQDCNTGAIAYGGGGNAGGATGADATQVIQSTINALRGVYGLVMFSGQLTLNGGLTLYPGIGIEGQGQLSAGTAGTSDLVVPVGMSGPAITVMTDPLHPSDAFFPYLGYFTIAGSGGTQSGQDGILVRDTSGTVMDFYIQNVNIMNVGGNCLNLQVGTGKVYANDDYFEHCGQNGILQVVAGSAEVTNSYIYGNSLSGVSLNSASGFSIAGSYIWFNSQRGIDDEGTNTAAAISGNSFSNNGGPAYEDLLISGSAQQAVVSGNMFAENRAAGSQASHAINVVGPASADITGNTISGTYGGGAVSVSGVNPKLLIANNLGFNPVGMISNPIGAGTVGLGGTGSSIAASTDYTAAGVELQITCMTNGATGVAITIKDNSGNRVTTLGDACSSSMNPIYLPIGYKIDWGAFTGGPPTVAVFGN